VEVHLYSFFNICARRGWVVNLTPRPLYPREQTQYPFCRRLGWSQSRDGRVRIISPPTWIRSHDLPARTELQYPAGCSEISKDIIHCLCAFTSKILAQYDRLRISLHCQLVAVYNHCSIATRGKGIRSAPQRLYWLRETTWPLLGYSEMA
jgi:hypothetical protein